MKEFVADYDEPGANAGFSDYADTLRQLGLTKAVNLLSRLDPGDTADGRNSHRVIAERLTNLGMPTQTAIFAPVNKFLRRPELFFSQIPDGDYYFCSIRPKLHLAHSTLKTEVVNFVKYYSESYPANEIFLAHCGEPVMSGHIKIADDGEPNSVLAEFTNGNFNAFHRGLTVPEIEISRALTDRFDWRFGGQLTADDWRTPDKFLCNGGVELSRPEMAGKIWQALLAIPHDGWQFLPGYYEAIMERTQDGGTNTVFVEANLDANF